MKVTRELYGQFLLNTQTNYTGTYLADHTDKLDHNSVYRYLKNEKLTPKLIWEKVKKEITFSNNGYIIFDDVVIIKDHSFKIDGVKKQYSGCKHGLAKGIGIVNCLYFTPESNQYWIIDYRIYDPNKDGKTKLDHMKEMLEMIKFRNIDYSTVLMDTWYATSEIMMIIHKKKKKFYCPIKTNRKVDDKLEFNQGKFQHISAKDLEWSNEELQDGKIVNLKGLSLKLRLFRAVTSSGKTELFVTNDLNQSSANDCQQEIAIRWKIEQFHREEKQITGIGKCECRLNRSQRNHICIAMLVWIRLKKIAYQLNTTVYQVKEQLLRDYMMQQMQNPTFVFF